MFHIGETTIEKIHETDLNGLLLGQLMPALDPAVEARHPDWIPTGTTDSEGHAFMSVHSWLVRHDGRTILIDTGIGNDKSRPGQPAFDQLDTPFLTRLAHAGVEPEDVDTILLTHVHADHVGWNTRLVDGEWVPTFPNAEIICSDLEWRYGAALASGDEAAIAACREDAGLGEEAVRIPGAGTFDDSMVPLEGRVAIRRIAVDGAEVLPGIRFIPTPGHSICHASIELVSGGMTALFSGDVFHHPVEVRDVDLVSMFCEFPEATRRSRRAFLERAADSDATVFSSHLPRSSAGLIRRQADGFAWSFVEEDLSEGSERA